jgi:hypothetical protein
MAHIKFLPTPRLKWCFLNEGFTPAIIININNN